MPLFDPRFRGYGKVRAARLFSGSSACGQIALQLLCSGGPEAYTLPSRCHTATALQRGQVTVSSCAQDKIQYVTVVRHLGFRWVHASVCEAMYDQHACEICLHGTSISAFNI